MPVLAVSEIQERCALDDCDQLTPAAAPYHSVSYHDIVLGW